MKFLFPELLTTFNTDGVLSGAQVGRKMYHSTEDNKDVLPQVVCERSDGSHNDTFGKTIEVYNIIFTLKSRGIEDTDNIDTLTKEFRRVFDNIQADSYTNFEMVCAEWKGTRGPFSIDGHWEVELSYEFVVEYI